MRVRSAADSAEKFARVAPDRARDYAAGVADANVDWQGPTERAKETWADGVSQAARDDRFAKGVKRSGTEHWRNKTTSMGVQRWPAGIREAKKDYEEGVAPYIEELSRVNLPPRAPRGDPRNIERVAAIAKALADRRMRGA